MAFGILFDLDGTLLDTLADLHAAVNFALGQMGYPARSMEEVRAFVGNGAGLLMARAVPEGGDAREALRIFRDYYGAHCREKPRPYGGIPQALEGLGEKYPLAIVSNKPDEAVKSLCQVYFPGIYARGERPDCPRKPAPDMLFKAMAEIGADSCVYVGDSEVDIQTAGNAGVPCLSVLWGFRDRAGLENGGGRYFCASPMELTEKIEEIRYGK